MIDRQIINPDRETEMPAKGQYLPRDKRCATCDGPMYHVARNRTFCSLRCYEMSKPRPTSKTCVGCRKVFAVHAATAHRYKFCSMACKRENSGHVIKPCARCGKPFKHSRGDIARGLDRHFCSESCRRPEVRVICMQCGANFRSVPFSAAERRFCSLACYRRFKGETRIEGMVRASLSRLGIPFVQEVRVGRWSIDFVIGRLALEVDGSYWHASAKQHIRDNRRDEMLRKAGWTVARINEDEIINSDDIDQLLRDRLQNVVDLDAISTNESAISPDRVIRRAYKGRLVARLDPHQMALPFPPMGIRRPPKT